LILLVGAGRFERPTSVIASKPAICDHFKTGQRSLTRT
jgi:hypothetical protein